ncbi:hypothetical protein [Actinoallomurus soli]|uniref:hypothetical protein n=1 Tax=Actinoallomurus soli TaxID=2952535 RepID=UPI002092A6C5|nr:hypothetical protein [Actinoallomurus soli]MCO5968977.1 hypothetical protein [Actinoallomurus soli]
MADHRDPLRTAVPDRAMGGRSARPAPRIVAVGALIMMATACTSSHHPGDHRTPRAQPSTHKSSCEVRVAESAVTRKDHYAAGERDQLNDQFLASAILENPCRRTATNVRFVVSALDGQGHELMSWGRPVQAHFTISLIMPGQRAAGWTYFDRQKAPDGVASVKVQLDTAPFGGEVCWIDPSTSGYQTAASATDVTIGKRDSSRTAANGMADVSFKVTWSPTESSPGRRSASVILRDSSGRLLDANGQSISAHLKPGQRVHFDAWVPENTDPSRTDVLLEPDPVTPDLPFYSPSSSCLPTS